MERAKTRNMNALKYRNVAGEVLSDFQSTWPALVNHNRPLDPDSLIEEFGRRQPARRCPPSTQNQPSPV